MFGPGEASALLRSVRAAIEDEMRAWEEGERSTIHVPESMGRRRVVAHYAAKRVMRAVLFEALLRRGRDA